MTTTITRSSSMRFEHREIWDVLADFGAIATWAGFVEHSSMLQAGPIEVGSTLRIQMGSTVVLERIVELDAPTTPTQLRCFRASGAVLGSRAEPVVSQPFWTSWVDTRRTPA